MYFTINSAHFDELRENWEEKKKLPSEIIESIEKIFSYWTQADKTPFGIRLETTEGDKIIGLCYGITLETKKRAWLSKVIIYLERAKRRKKRRSGKKITIKTIEVVSSKYLLLKLKKIEFFKSPSYYHPLLSLAERKKFIQHIQKPLK